MNSKKIAIIHNGDGLSWESCIDISQGLRATYAYLSQVSGCEIKYFAISPQRIADWSRVFEEIKKFDPEVLAIHDHHPYPVLFFRFLMNLRPLKIWLHLYGCFRFWCDSLNLYRDVFIRHEVFFFCPSQAQTELIQQGFPTGVYHLPFAIEKGVSAAERRQSEIPLIVYAGRLHLQKNTLTLIRFMKELRKEFEFKFVLCGMYDNSPIDRLGVFNEYGTIESLHEKELAGTDFEYLGKLSKADLSQLYAQASLHISLSTYNDEDFGISPLEAFVAGVPGILTAWGGYRDYQSPWCDLLDVQVKNGDLVLAFEQFRELFLQGWKKSFRANEISDFYLKRFSAEAVAQKLLPHLESRLNPVSSDFKMPYTKGRLSRWTYLKEYKPYYA